MNTNNMTAALKNLGCKVNEYETKAMEKRLSEAGFTIVPFSDKADVYVINTCTVTAVADQKSRQMLRRAKRENPDAVIVCAGCFAETFLAENDEEKLKEETGADLIILNDEKGKIDEKVISFLESRKQISNTDEAVQDSKDLNEGEAAFDGKNADNISSVENNEMDIRHRDTAATFEELCFSEPSDRTRSFLKIQDGCDHFCSYCLIPFARGKSRSRSMEASVKEAEHLAEEGFSEIVITGVDVAAYGRDFDQDNQEKIRINYFSEKKKISKTDQQLLSTGSTLTEDKQDNTNYYLLLLVLRISLIQGIRRIRFGSLDPDLITEDFVKELSEIPKICPHFHLSLQSGSDAVLKRMNRHYTKEDYRKAVELLRKYFDDPAITTDIISGFQGETDSEFEETCDFVKKINFYEVHNFPYSIRKGTRAESLPGRVKNVIKENRVNKLIDISKKQAVEYRRRHIGKEVSVLFESDFHRIADADKEDFIDATGFYVTGLSEEYIRCAVKVKNEEEADALKHTIREGRIIGFLTDEIMEIV